MEQGYSFVGAGIDIYGGRVWHAWENDDGSRTCYSYDLETGVVTAEAKDITDEIYGKKETE